MNSVMPPSGASRRVEARGRRLLDELATDMAIARTAVVRNRSHSVAAVAVIAIGMTAATHMANEFNAAFWRPLPVQIARIAAYAGVGIVADRVSQHPGVRGPAARWPSDVRLGLVPGVQGGSGRGRACSRSWRCWIGSGRDLPVVMGELGVGSVSFVSGNFFTTLGVNPALGRLLTPDDDSETVPVPVAILSERFWRATFGGNPDVLDKRLTLNGTPFRIVGVAESGFFGLDPSHAPDVMVPIGMLHIAAAGGPGVLQTQANWSVCRMVGRLRDGVSDDAARAAAQAAMLRSVTTTPKWPPRGRVYDWPTLAIIPIERGLDGLRAAAGRPMLIVSIVVGVLLAIAVANVAGLLLARGVAREPEVATRLALGAGRARVLRQFIGEALLLSSAGGAIGFMLSSILSAWMPSLLAQLAPTFHASSRPLGVSIAPELRVAALSFGASVIAALIFGALPALRAARLSLSEAARGAAASRPGRSVAGHVVVALQAALAMFLVVGAAMFVRTVTNLQSVDLGFTTDRLLYVRVEPRGGGLRTGADGLTAGDYARRRAALFQEVLEPLGAAPGVIAASATITPPLAAYRRRRRFRRVARGVHDVCQRDDCAGCVVCVAADRATLLRDAAVADPARQRFHVGRSIAGPANCRDRQRGVRSPLLPEGRRSDWRHRTASGRIARRTPGAPRSSRWSPTAGRAHARPPCRCSIRCTGHRRRL